VKSWKAFDIEIIKFKEGLHEIVFDIKDDFFSQVEGNELLEKGKLTARVNLNKGANVMELTFHVQGSVELTCDRSLELFWHPLSFTERMIYKFGSREEELDDLVMMITRDTPSINVAQLLYEFILLALPAKKIHPNWREEEEDETSEGGFVYLDQEREEESFGVEPEKKVIDPRWEQLLKLKK